MGVHAFTLKMGIYAGERGYHFLRNGGVLNILGGSEIFGKKNRGGHKIFNDQNVGSHNMTTDSVFILFKKTDYISIEF